MRVMRLLKNNSLFVFRNEVEESGVFDDFKKFLRQRSLRFALDRLDRQDNNKGLFH